MAEKKDEQRADENKRNSKETTIEEINEVKLKDLEVRLEGVKDSVKRSRTVFIVMTIASAAILITLWNSYLSWTRDFAFNTSQYLFKMEDFKDPIAFTGRLENKNNTCFKYIFEHELTDGTRKKLARYASQGRSLDRDAFREIKRDLNDFLTRRRWRLREFFDSRCCEWEANIKERNFENSLESLLSASDVKFPENLKTDLLKKYNFVDKDEQVKLKRLFLNEVFQDDLVSSVKKATNTQPVSVGDSGSSPARTLSTIDSDDPEAVSADDYNRKQVVGEWVKNMVISVGLLGIRVGVDDLVIVGGLALFIITAWFFFSVRRENRIVWSLFRDLHHNDEKWTLKYIAYQTVVQSQVFLDTGSEDKPMNDIEEKPFNEFPKDIESFEPWWITKPFKLRRKLFYPKEKERTPLSDLLIHIEFMAIGGIQNDNKRKEIQSIKEKIKAAKKMWRFFQREKLKNLLTEILNFAINYTDDSYEKNALLTRFKDFHRVGYLPRSIREKLTSWNGGLNPQITIDKPNKLKCLLIDLAYPEIGKRGKRLTVVRSLVKCLFFLPPITISLIIVADIVSLFFNSPFRNSVDSLYNVLRTEWTESRVSFFKLVGFEITGAFFTVLTLYLCYKCNSYFAGISDCISQFRKELDYKEEDVEYFFKDNKETAEMNKAPANGSSLETCSVR